MGWFSKPKIENELGQYLPDSDAQPCTESEENWRTEQISSAKKSAKKQLRNMAVLMHKYHQQIALDVGIASLRYGGSYG